MRKPRTNITKTPTTNVNIHIYIIITLYWGVPELN